MSSVLGSTRGFLSLGTQLACSMLCSLNLRWRAAVESADDFPGVVMNTTGEIKVVKGI
jgi:hypothetical protein